MSAVEIPAGGFVYPYCQVVGDNAVVLLFRGDIEAIARALDHYPVGSRETHIAAEMRMALLRLNEAREHGGTATPERDDV